MRRKMRWLIGGIMACLLAAGMGAGSHPARTQAADVHVALAAGPWVNLSASQALIQGFEAAPTPPAGAEPVSLAILNPRQDGTPVLVAGYATATGGILGMYGDAAAHEPARLIEAPQAPDFLGAGDFDADGIQDLIVAARAGEALWLFTGNAAGEFAPADMVALPGRLTALVAGEIGRQDGLTDLAIGVTTPEGAELLVLSGAQGALAATPARYPLPAPVTALAIGQLDAAYPFDLAIIAGQELHILYSSDQFIVEQSPSRLITHPLEFAPLSLALGDFLGDDRQTLEIALLDAGGRVHILECNHDGEARVSRVLETPPSHAAQLLTAKISSLPADDLIIVDRDAGKIEILNADGRRLNPAGVLEQVASPGVLATLRAAAAPVAALPVRLNGDGLDDLLLLSEETPALTAVVTAPVHTFVVESLNDGEDDNPGDGKCRTRLFSGVEVCTLRGALQEANASAGLDEIQLNISRGGWSTDRIRPNQALPDITEVVWVVDVWPNARQIIDGRNLPAGIGLHIRANNTVLDDLAFVDFINTSTAHPVIKISLAGGNVIRNCQIGPNNAGVGVELNSGANRIHNSIIAGNGTGARVAGGNSNVIGPANYIGFGTEGSGATNQTGIQVVGATNVEIGDPAPPPGVNGGANIISGNRGQGIRLEDTATSGTLILKNHIGLNPEGAAGWGNGAPGISIAAGAAATTIGNNTTAGRNLIGDNASGIIINHGYTTADAIIQGNYIGVNANANASIANDNAGIEVDCPAIVQVLNNVIGGSPTSSYGVRITYDFARTLAHQIHNNAIGTNMNGALNLGNGLDGVSIARISGVQISANTIGYNGQDGIAMEAGGASTLSNNMVFRNGRDGMDLAGNAYVITGNTVNYNAHSGIWVQGQNNTLSNNGALIDIQSYQIGINLQGSDNVINTTTGATIGGGLYGVALEGNRNTLSGYTIQDATTGILVGGTDNVIGPANRIHGNLIGIEVRETANRTLIRSNTMGVDAAGNAAAPNYDVSILIGGDNTTVGGSSAGDGNVISGGGSYGATGLHIWNGSGAIVRNNKIGVGVDGATPLGNLTGIRITGGAQSTLQDNLVAYNGKGILIEQGARHAIVGNSIHSNTTLGIDLSPAGVTLNDSGDGDAGANTLQNFPVITLAGITGSNTRAVGMLDSLPNKTYTIRLYSNPTCDDAGHGEGRTYLGQGTVSTGASGQANIDLTLAAASTQGHYLTATATDSQGNTSEFSACFGPLGILGADTFTVNAIGDAVDNNITDGICDTSAAAGTQCTLRAAVQQANANVGANRIILPAGTYPLTLAGSDAVAATGDLDITDDLLLTGAGANVTLIQSEVADRVFEIRNNATVDIVGVTVRGGNLTSSANGAGILVNSGTTLTLDAASIQENQTASGSGGGLYSQGTLNITSSAVISNTAGAETNGGGGLFVLSGVTTLRNTTVSGNQTKGNGGGIHNLAGTVRLNNVTVVYNTADSDNDGGDGGGLYNLLTCEVKNTIVAENTDLSAGSYPRGKADCSGTFTSQGYNLVGDKAQPNNATPPACTGFGATGSHDSVGGFWLLTRYLTWAAGVGPLQLNGGATLSHSPVAAAAGLVVDFGNPATPNGSGNACEPFDQRGQARPIDGGTDGIAECDRGAVEHIPAYLSIDDTVVVEGSTATFNVTLSTPAQITFTVHYSTTGITAVAGQDFTHVAGTLTFNRGQSSKTLSAPALADALNEDTETFRMRLYQPQWVFIADGEGIASIADGSPQPALLINDQTATEGDVGNGGQAVFVVTLNTASGKTVTVDYTTVNGAALAGEDFAPAQGQLVFEPGVASRTIVVNLIGDDLREGNETFSVQLSNPSNAALGDATGQGTITDDDTPACAVADSAAPEPESGVGVLVFIATLSKPSTQPVTVHYTTRPGAATPGSDYVATSGTLSFAAGETLKSVSVTLNADAEAEPNETLFLDLDAPTGGAIIATGTATGTILGENAGGATVFLPLVIR
ncbi:MAG: right-handed parallel beta-helix repeat-containing protein [Anaerolineae bacterium]|nr:right-handed parallel beta-helix repeat-containing protein [Anaerolineae bacterium]